ncbi:MAG: hypothetical protein AAF153_01140, partial [Pseudomonadota bacterium]
MLSNYTGHVWRFGVDDPNEELIMRLPLQPSDVIVATHLAGRGADPKISKTVADHGGLLLILGSFPENQRVEDQAYGRAARNGAIGSAVMIVNNRTIDSDCREIQCYYEEREQQQTKHLFEEIAKIHLPTFTHRDALYEKYIALNRLMISPNGFDLMLKDFGTPATELTDKHIYLYQDKTSGKIFAEIEQPQSTISSFFGFGAKPKIDLSALLPVLKPEAARHLAMVFTKFRPTMLNLNYLDFEAIHFLVTTELSDIDKTHYILNHDGELFGDNKNILPRIFSRYYHELSQSNIRRDANLLDYKSPLFNDDKEFYFLTHFARYHQDFTHLNVNRVDPPSDDQLLQAKRIKLFGHWLQDRKDYNVEIKLNQLSDNWGMWLKHDLGDSTVQPTYFANGTINDEELLANQADSYQMEHEAVDKFIVKQHQQSKQINYIENPHYFVKAAWHYQNVHLHEVRDGIFEHIEMPKTKTSFLDSFTNMANKAIKNSVLLAKQSLNFLLNYQSYDISTHFQDDFINIDDPLAAASQHLDVAQTRDHRLNWAVHNLRAIIDLTKIHYEYTSTKQAEAAHDAKQKYIQTMAAAVSSLENYIIPHHEAQLYQAMAKNISDPASELTEQLLGYLRFYEQVKMRMLQNIDKVYNTNGAQMIALSNGVTFADIMELVDISEINEAQATSTNDPQTLNTAEAAAPQQPPAKDNDINAAEPIADEATDTTKTIPANATPANATEANINLAQSTNNITIDSTIDINNSGINHVSTNQILAANLLSASNSDSQANSDIYIYFTCKKIQFHIKNLIVNEAICIAGILMVIDIFV